MPTNRLGDTMPKSAHEMASDAIVRSIVKGELAPGLRLHQGNLAARLGISTTPVREALTDLSGQGLVRLDTHRGAYVTKLGADELRDVYAFRAVAESQAIKLTVARITDEEMREALRLVEQMESTRDPVEYVFLNHKFHGLLSTACRSAHIASVLTTLRNVTLLYVARAAISSPQILEASDKEHRRLIKACENRDPIRAADVIQKHMLSTLELAVAEARDLTEDDNGTKSVDGPLVPLDEASSIKRRRP